MIGLFSGFLCLARVPGKVSWPFSFKSENHFSTLPVVLLPSLSKNSKPLGGHTEAARSAICSAQALAYSIF